MNISCKAISKAYAKGIYGVKELSLEVESGEFLVVMGESGCGKSTLLRLLSGIYRPDSGELSLDGIPANSLIPQMRDCAMIFQDYSLYPNLSVYDNVGFYLKSQGLTPEEVRERILPVLDFMGLKNFLNVKPKFLSGGQQQRVCLAKALVRRPKLLLFDEPLSNIDEQAREKYLTLIKETKKLLPHTTFVYVTHNGHEARFLADRIAVMLDGTIVDIGTVEELSKNPQTLDTVYLLNENPTVLKGKIDGGKFIGEKEFDLEPYALETLSGNTDMVFCAVNPFGYGYNNYFDVDSKTITGFKKEIKISANYHNGKISILKQKIDLSDIQKDRYFGNEGQVKIVLDSEKLHKIKCSGDFCLELTKIKEVEGLTVFECGEDKVVLKGNYPQNLTLYYSAEDISISDIQGDRVLTKYAIYPNICSAMVSSNQLKIAKNKFDFVAESGYYDIEIYPQAFISLCKKQKNALLIKECLAEDTLGKKKLIHCLVDGFDNYVTLIVDSKLNLLKNKNFYVLLDTKQIRIKK